MRIALLITSSLLGLAACMPRPAGPEAFRATIEPTRVESGIFRGEGPPDADPNACYGLQTEPAIVETVTEQVILRPATEATQTRAAQPAQFRTETRQRIVQERQEIWFETPCQLDRDPEFIASLQRALRARNLYRGPINGEMTGRTRRAIRDFQAPQGLDSPVLSLAAARQLGLAIWDPALAAGGNGG